MISQRDLRIDFFRGLALMIVIVDHVEGWSRNSLLDSWTLISLGFSDAAEVFVFLSGYVYAIAYSKALDKDGVWACVRKAVGRSLQIYVAYLLAAWTVISIGSLLVELDRPFGDGLRVGDRALESVLQSLALRFQPYGFPILAFYVLVLPVMAILLYLLRSAPALAWLTSATSYLAVQFYPQINLPRFADGSGWFFNPFAWQFLFFVGMYMGTESATWRALRIPRAPVIVFCVVILALGVFVVKVAPGLTRHGSHIADSIRPLLLLCSNWAAKPTLGPMRLVHFFGLTYVVSQLLPAHLTFWSGRAAVPLVVCGQQSLQLYAFGLVVAFIAVIIVSPGNEPALNILMLDVDSCLASALFAFWLNCRSRSMASQVRV